MGDFNVSDDEMLDIFTNLPDLKEERKSIAQELAAKASLRLHTS
jgi:hypothetical protein